MTSRWTIAGSVLAMAFAAPALAQSNSTVNQTGDNNSTNVTQVGSSTGHTVTVDQISDADGSPGNVAIVIQSDPNGNPGNTGDIDQDGIGPNTANLTQNGTGNLGTINQTGDSAGATATITQLGFSGGDMAQITQTGNAGGAPNAANIFQNGSDGNPSNNFSSILQGDTTLAAFPGSTTGGGFSFATSSQSGDNLVSDIVQGGNNNFAQVNQEGNGSSSIVAQGDIGGEGGFAVVSQGGGANESGVFQASLDSHAFVNQLGADNFSGVEQGSNGGLGLDADSNVADVDQTGDGNSSEVFQGTLTSGPGNIANVLQDGDDSTSIITQDGSSNTVNSFQYDGSTSTVTQNGTGNNATVTQGTAPAPI